MNTNKQEQKSVVAQKEEAILAFWNEHNIFKKTLEKESPRGDFVFYDGPPFATGLPHYGHLLPGTMKDIIPRYKTMQGYHVARKWGWDCHGLPIENLIEKELNLATKKDIESYGIEKFNEAARDSVLRYEQEWKHYIPRSGRWVDMDDPYMSMQPSYMESLWWVFSELHAKGLTLEGFKAMHLCPRCETTLANFEVNQGYQDITDISATVKFELVDEPGTFLLAWTTTPWTLPGNVALAVGNEIDYVLVSHEQDTYIVAQERCEDVFVGKEYRVVKTIKGSELVGKLYKAPFDFYQQQDDLENKEKGWSIHSADFVSTFEGTGIVHIAPAFGSDDLELGKLYELPFVQHINRSGAFKDDFAMTSEGTSFKGMEVKKKNDTMSADIEIIKVLAHKGLLFSKQKLVHSYPHCWRCDTPLLNYATGSWYVDVPKIKDQLLQQNKDIHWVPEHIGEGRFGKWLEGAREWALSRSRFWGTPLPVWKSKDGEETLVIGSFEQLLSHIKSSGNVYYGMRHGESESNSAGTVNVDPNTHNPLTEKGRNQAQVEIEKLPNNIDYVFVSPFERTRETAKLVQSIHGLSDDQIIVDERLRERSPGAEWEGKLWDDAHAQEEAQDPDNFWEYKLADDAESIFDVYQRIMDFMFDIEKRYQDKTILIVSHGGVLKTIQFAIKHFGEKKYARDFYNEMEIPKNADILSFDFKPFPHNPEYLIDVHRPYIDDIILVSQTTGNELYRIEDVFDVWFDSGSMPYAQVHYPFENKEDFLEKRFPADFVAESLDQTRGWFYVMLVLGISLFGTTPFKNVAVGGLVLAEDGKKMSKSLKNYPEMHIVLDSLGADALRFFLMLSPLVRAEEHPFSEKGVQEVQSKVMGRLRNILSMYQLYAEEVPHTAHRESSHTLDRWIVARLDELNQGVTDNLESYQFDKAARYILDFVDDFSTWYVRRSRDRYKGEDMDDRIATLSTTRYVLIETSKIIAPFIPFIAEELWQELRDTSMSESVHLSSWSSYQQDRDEQTLTTMQTVRTLVSQGLQLRAKANIKVRQPLALLRAPLTSIPSEYHELILDEMNVKTLEDGEFFLDTTLTPDLIQEGQFRELLRFVQNLRKESGLEPQDSILLNVHTNAEGRALVEAFKSELERVAGVGLLHFEAVEGVSTDIDGIAFSLSLHKQE